MFIRSIARPQEPNGTGHALREGDAVKSKGIKIPAGLRFADLALAREPVTKRLLCKTGPLAELVRINNWDPRTLVSGDDLPAWLIAEWYLAHRLAGGEPDAVAEEILIEVAVLQANATLARRQDGDVMH
jgi:hypothetical protein